MGDSEARRVQAKRRDVYWSIFLNRLRAMVIRLSTDANMEAMCYMLSDFIFKFLQTHHVALIRGPR